MSGDSNSVPLIKESGDPFGSDEVESLSKSLSALSSADRTAARNANSAAIAAHDGARMLVVSGPGTGKSTLFKARLSHWLETHPDHRVAVATFVRKLVKDLTDDIERDEELSTEAKARAEVMTLHRHARSVVERNRGTNDLRLDRHCLVITREWEEMVWQDTVSLHADVTPQDYPWDELLDHLYDGELPTEATWAELRELHLRLQQFYNALNFADLIVTGTQAAVENPELVENVLFIIDEFQDFNLAEDAFIRAITADSRAVLLAGDDDQVLYDQLRRGHASIIRGYYRDTAFIKAMLPFCSRCSYHICCAAQAFLEAGRPPESIEKVFLPLDDETEAERVAVVASTSPKSGVQYIENFLESHADGIAQRQTALEAGTEKDPYLLILSPAREMKFLNVSGAREQLRGLLATYAPGDQRPGFEYWRLVDYYYAGVRPSQNYNLRKVLSYEGVEQEIVTRLLAEALAKGKNLADLDHEVIRACLEKCTSVRSIIEAEEEPAAKAEAADLGLASNAPPLATDLERRPIHGETEPDADSADPEQSTTTGAVDFTTIVGAKGLTAEHVIVVGCDDVNLEHISRNAFLVALTRGRKSVTLLACVGGGGASTLHPFVCSLPADHTRAVYAKTGGTEDFESIGSMQERLEKWAYARKMSAKK